jgi:capsular polysaccharide export protein
VNPESGQRCEVEAVLAHLALQRRMRGRFPPVVYALGFSPYKKPIVRRYFWGSEVRFVRRAQAVPRGATLAVWGRREVDAAEDRIAADDTGASPTLPGGARARRQLVRLEDGFLRSVGLGADLVRPLSWVMDRRGIYYDATSPSDLEHLLQTGSFEAGLLARARALRERIVAEGLTKYNVGTGGWRRPSGSRRVILVPGQVEVDASIAFGAPGIRSNIALLRAVREAHPGAYLLYKPHPDVLAGLRAKGDGEDAAQTWCDEQVTNTGMAELLSAVDAVHVLTSLAGFEALLRGKAVTCYGQPFYAGWGLTNDVVPVPRRTRRLSLDELIAGALILYPTYVSRSTGRFTTPERALEELLAWRDRGAPLLPFWRRGLRVALRLLVRRP